MMISMSSVQKKMAGLVAGVSVLAASFIGAPLSQVAVANGPTVTVTGFPAQAQTGQDAIFSVNLAGFTATDTVEETTVDRIFQVELSVSDGNGILTLAPNSDTTASPGTDGDEAASIRFTGTLDVVNQAMENMTYKPATAGSVDLRVSATHIPSPLAPSAHSTAFEAFTPVRWVGEGANGHFYEFVRTAGTDQTRPNITWQAARDAAAERSLLGKPGYLVTLTTAAENSFVANEIDARDIWIGASDDVNEIFTTADPPVKKYADQDEAEGKWHWVTGPEAGTQFMDANSTGTTLTEGRDTCTRTSGGALNYQGITTAGQFSSWACGEPNNSSSGGVSEHFAVTNWQGGKGEWNDLLATSSVKGFLVEYSGFDAPQSAQATASTNAFTIPDAPTISSIDAGNKSLTINVTPGSNGGSTLTNYEYSTDNGVTFRAFSPAVTANTFTITTLSSDGTTLLENGTTYQVQVKAVNAAGASLATASSAGVPTAQKPSAPVISSVTAGNQTLTVAFTVADGGGSPVTSVEYALDGGNFQAFSAPTSPGTITGLTNATAYSIAIRAINDAGTSDNSASATGTPVAPAPQAPTRRSQPPAVDPALSQPTGGNTVTQVLPPSRTPTPGTAPAPLAGPLPGINGNGGQAPTAPTAIIGGRTTPVDTNVTGTNQVDLQTGTSSFGMTIPQGQGGVSSQGGNTELAVSPGAQTRLSGSGLFPGSTVQVFMPLGANGSREIAQLPVDPSGSFDGDAVFTTRPTDPPLPIGRHVLQIASLNEAGERVVVEMAINIAQPSPAPEILRSNGDIPGLLPGQSLVTQAGVPIDVSLTVDSSNSLTTVQGDGWLFSINLGDGGNSVEETADGGALLSVLRGGEASISGNGFMPLSRADIWLFSDPTLLGSVEIDENGEFNGNVTVDGRVVPVGDHTLQIQGVGVDGFVLAANLGVVVSDADAAGSATTTEQASSSLLWWVLALVALLAILGTIWWVRTRRQVA